MQMKLLEQALCKSLADINLTYTGMERIAKAQCQGFTFIYYVENESHSGTYVISFLWNHYGSFNLRKCGT